MRGKQGKSVRGEVTAYLSLIFILLVTFVGGVMESATIQVAKNYHRADMNRAMECIFAEYQKELLEEYDIFALDGSYETGQYTSRNIMDRLSYYGAGNMEQEVTRIRFLTDKGCAAFRDQAASYMEHKYGMGKAEELLGMTSVWGQQAERADDYAKEEQAQQEYLDGLLEENEGELPEEGNPIRSVGELKKSPILTLVMPKDQNVSEKRIDRREMLAHRSRNSGYGEFSDVAAEDKKVSALLFGEYLLKHFRGFTKTDHAGVLDYELEYILAGKDSDRENLESVVKKLLLLRFVPNYTYILTDSEMRAEAEATALTLCTLLAVPAITEAAAQGILLAWAYGEAIMDLRSLLKGSKVPLIKSKESWQLQLARLLTLGTEEDYNDGRDDMGGLAYTEYLRMLLFLEDQETAAARALGAAEQNLRKIHGQAYFRADLCISRLEVRSVCKLRRGIRYQFQTYYDYH